MLFQEYYVVSSGSKKNLILLVMDSRRLSITKILKDCIIISVGGNINKYRCFVCDAVPLEPFENVIFFVAV